MNQKNRTTLDPTSYTGLEVNESDWFHFMICAHFQAENLFYLELVTTSHVEFPFMMKNSWAQILKTL
jgi:hypothetical protein